MQEYSGSERPLIPGTLRGFREWLVIDPEGTLGALNYQWTDEATNDPRRPPDWTPGINEAVCMQGLHQAPPGHHPGVADGRCCGFYAKYVPRGLNETASPVRVTGIIEGSGRISLGTRGFRAQKAEIVALVMDEKTLRVSRRPITFFTGKEFKTGGPVPTLAEIGERYTVPVFKDWGYALKMFPVQDLGAIAPEIADALKYEEKYALELAKALKQLSSLEVMTQRAEEIAKSQKLAAPGFSLQQWLEWSSKNV